MPVSSINQDLIADVRLRVEFQGGLDSDGGVTEDTVYFSANKAIRNHWVNMDYDELVALGVKAIWVQVEPGYAYCLRKIRD